MLGDRDGRLPFCDGHVMPARHTSHNSALSVIALTLPGAPARYP
jgi:hypothetical protein